MKERGLQLGEKILCKFTELTHAYAEILNIKTDHGKILYFVHFIQYDKRLDRWVKCEDILPMSEKQKVTLSAKDQEKSKILTRGTKRKIGELFSRGIELEELCPGTTKEERKYGVTLKTRNIEKIFLGIHEINTMYFSPFSEKYKKEKELYICEKCLKYFSIKSSFITHFGQCSWKAPPGKLIYYQELIQIAKEDPKAISVYEVDGAKQKRYCQRLCLLTKLFLEHKTMNSDISSFYFYILLEESKAGSAIAGYFSKEKIINNDNNLSCFLVLPPYQCKGYGKLLISISYYLSRRENRICGPERPLSEIGKICYDNYWTDIILQALREEGPILSIEDISEKTKIRKSDVLSTLQGLNLVKFSRGKPILSPIDFKVIDQYIKPKKEKLKTSKRQTIKFNSSAMQF